MANPNISVDVGGNTAKLRQQINQVAKQPLVIDVQAGARGAAQPLGKLSGQITEIDKSLAAANARVIAFGAAAGSIFALQNAVVSLFQSFVNTEKKLQDINVILNLSQKNLASFGSSLFDIAGNTAQAFDVVAEAATELSRQGLGVEETLKRTEAALVLTRLSGLDAAASVAALTAAMNSFQSTTLEATEIVNKLANVDAAFAVSSADLANALSRVGSSADDAGISFDELIALVTTAQQITARGGSVIGNSLKTIFTRLGREKVQEVLGGLGISATDENGQVKTQIQLLKELALVYDTLGATQKNYVAEQVGGVFQINILKAALSDLGKEYSIYDRALKTSLSTTDQAIQRNQQLNQTLSALGTKTLANVQKAAGAIGEGLFGDAARNVLNLTNLLAESVTDADSQSVGGQIGKGVIDGLGKFISGPGLALATAIIVKLLAEFTKYGAEAFKSILGANQAGKEQAIVQQNIAKFLQNNSSLYNSILKGQTSVSAAAKEYLTVIQQQTLALQKQNSVAASISKSLAGTVGVATVGGKQYVATKGNQKTAAGGYLPESIEQANINARVGGANPATDRPVTIPNFAFGGGKKGKVTAHTGEWVVPNFAGGDGTAIFNKDMKKRYGLPDGARKISASGFIPDSTKAMLPKNINGRNIFQVRWLKEMAQKRGINLKDPEAVFKLGIEFSKKYPQNQNMFALADGFIPNFASNKYSYALSTFAGKGIKNPRAASQFDKYFTGNPLKNIERDDRISGVGFDLKKLKLPPDLQKLYDTQAGSAIFASEFEKYAIQKLGFVNAGTGGAGNVKLYGATSSAVDGYQIGNGIAKFLEVKSGGFDTLSVANKFGRVLPENLKRLPAQELKKIFKEGVREKQDIVQLQNTLAVPDVRGSRSGNFNKPFRVSDIEASRARNKAGGFIPNFAQKQNVENINLGDISSNPAYRSKLVSVIIPQPSKKLLKFNAKAKYGDKTYTTSGFPVSGPNPDVTKGLSSQGIPNLHRSIGKTLVDQANIFGQSLGAKNFITSASQLPNLGGVNSAAGIAFEAGVRNAIGSSIGSKNARVDFTSTNPKIKQIFNNAPGVYEAKNRPSTNLINDGFLKFLSRARPGGVQLTTTKGIAQRAARVKELTAQGLSKVQRNKILKSEGLAADGFIPNFANIQAIQELMMRGATLGERSAAQAALVRIQQGALKKLGSPDKLIKFKELLYGSKSNAGFNLDAIKIKDLSYKPLVAGARELGLTNKDLELLANNPMSLSQLKNFNSKTNNRSKFLARGFIPNFAAQAAKTNKGIPVSKIRAHFDGSGNPVAVTNTMHEPNGLKDAIKRERMGIGMSSPKSSGFIPNFAVGNEGEAQGGMGDFAKSIGAVATQIALFASISQLGNKDVNELKQTYKQRAELERKAISQQKENVQKMSTMGPGPLQRGSSAYNAAMLDIEQRAQAQRAARRSSTGMLQQGVSSVKGFRPGIGTAFVAPIIAETIANAIPKNTQGGRVGASIASGAGQVASFAGTGGMVGMAFGPKGAAVGAALGAVTGGLVGLTDILKQLNTNLPELQAKAEKSTEELARVNEKTQGLITSYETYTRLLEENAPQSELRKAEQNYINYLNSFDPETAKKFTNAIEKGGMRGLAEASGEVAQKQAEQTTQNQTAVSIEQLLNSQRKSIVARGFDFMGQYGGGADNPGMGLIDFLGDAGNALFGTGDLPSVESYYSEVLPEIRDKFKEQIRAAVTQGLTGSDLEGRLAELGGKEQIQKDFGKLISDTLKIDPKDIEGSSGFKKVLSEIFGEIFDEASINIKGQAEKTGSLAAGAIKDASKKIAQQLSQDIDSLLSYRKDTSAISQLENDFFGGEIGQNEFVARRSQERIKEALSLGATPEEIFTRFGSDVMNVRNQASNNAAQRAFDLGLPVDFQNRARMLNQQAVGEATGTNKLGVEYLKNRFLPEGGKFEGSSQEVKDAINTLKSLGGLSGSKEDFKAFEVTVNAMALDLTASSKTAAENFKLIEEAVVNILNKIGDSAGVQNPINTDSIPRGLNATKETAPPDVFNTPASITINPAPLTITLGSMDSGDLDIKLTAEKQRILDEVNARFQLIKAQNNLR
jgi:TP901 family phage tail tape measure protein